MVLEWHMKQYRSPVVRFRRFVRPARGAGFESGWPAASSGSESCGYLVLPRRLRQEVGKISVVSVIAKCAGPVYVRRAPRDML